MAKEAHFPWMMTAGAAVALIAGAVVFVRVPAEPNPQKGRAVSPTLGLRRLETTPSNDVTAEQLAAYDPTPLFLPTALSSSQRQYENGSGGRGGVPFAELKPALKFPENVVELDFPAPVKVPEDGVDGLRFTERREKPLAIGQLDAPAAKLAARLGQVEAAAIKTGEVMMRLTLPVAAQGPTEDWQPLEVVGAVNRAGLVGNLVVVKTSGSERVDEFFREHLSRVTQLGARLRPGIYTFRVGP